MKWRVCGTPGGRFAVYEVVEQEIATLCDRAMADVFVAMLTETASVTVEVERKTNRRLPAGTIHFVHPETAPEPEPTAVQFSEPEPVAPAPETAPEPEPTAVQFSEPEPVAPAPETAPQPAPPVADPINDDAVMLAAFQRLETWAHVQMRKGARDRKAAPTPATPAQRPGWRTCPRCRTDFNNADLSRTHCAVCWPKVQPGAAQ